MLNIGAQLMKENNEGRSITPLFDNTFRAFKECPYNKLKVVVLGLDPYPGKGIADGLAFSARNHDLDKPASLRYILSAMEKDAYGGFGIGYNPDYDVSDLTRWANQGVLLLNQALTTHVGKIGVHLQLWQPFIINVFKMLRANNTGIIFILIGTEAKMYKVLINDKANHIFTTVHPSYAARMEMKEWDCDNIFSKTNELLEKSNGSEAKILW